MWREAIAEEGSSNFNGNFYRIYPQEFFARLATNGDGAKIARPKGIFYFINGLAGGAFLFFHMFFRFAKAPLRMGHMRI